MSKNFTITILGSSSAVPTSERFPTAQLVSCYGRHYLLDCGEGTQIQLRKYKISFQRIDRIFISHLHADHFLGLPGLLSTMDLLGRTTDLHIHVFEELNIFMTGFLNATATIWSFPVHIHPMPKKKNSLLFENEHVEISCFPVKHAIPCNGFLIKEKQKPRNINKSFVEEYQPDIEAIHKIKNGADYVLKDGTRLNNESITSAPPLPRSYAFVTDTAYTEKILPFIEGVTLLYHEATFDKNLAHRAKATTHSTAAQAAEIAMKANVEKLMIGHYSVRYDDLSILLKEAQEVFRNTITSHEGLTLEV